ncbi:DUF2520 domain-containing protein [Rhodobacteraceae bacterium HSP-20]|uniref:DUF2520 domain-containing protein n=1 Tax=Paragemmobacter amnigenus TaxID=2852097 RepID=A0ABS6J8Y6_9RHOB|nr:DUF2520 domain-containing protein [Rhodobacter amnigenus]MBU9698937.1 DUF2520 domain-containing protein [Rhodobacter amnigenus]MBV4390164.1 DUF2520 domain-containing protein [Rhodobacter amnigenus]
MSAGQVQRINFIGTGKVGETLMRRIKLSRGCTVGEVASGHVESAVRAVVSTGVGIAVAALDRMESAEIWILAVPDRDIYAVALALAQSPRLPSWGCPVVCHCSGFHSLDVLSPLKSRGWRTASFHPVMSFSDPEAAAARFPGTLCGIEGDAPDEISLLVESLGGKGFSIEPDRKALYHAAAVFSSNFTVVLQAIALAAWKEAGVSEEVATQLSAALLTGTAANVVRDGPQVALTGPAARNEEEVIRQEEAVLAQWRPGSAALYHDLTTLARTLKLTGRVYKT